MADYKTGDGWPMNNIRWCRIADAPVKKRRRNRGLKNYGMTKQNRRKRVGKGVERDESNSECCWTSKGFLLKKAQKGRKRGRRLRRGRWFSYRLRLLRWLMSIMMIVIKMMIITVMIFFANRRRWAYSTRP